MQHNKQREELHRLQERHPEIAAKAAVRATNVQVSESEEESSEEDEVCELAAPKPCTHACIAATCR